MPISKDQLFCRLAVRQGLLTKEEAVEFLAAFREDARVGQGIGEYLIDQGILDPELLKNHVGGF
ncbi:MAG: hypothetical protein ACE5GW_07590, partial [Planctomycetota bacterium]